MLLDAKRTYVVPDQTAQVARAIFPKGNLVIRLYDDLPMVVEDRDFADLFPAQKWPAEAPVRLALATLLQFMEGLTDQQAADAVRTRIDWKYLLCLELTDVGFDHTAQSEFRTRLLAHGHRAGSSTQFSRAGARARAAEGRRTPAQRLHARPRGDAQHEPTRSRWGNCAPRAERAGDDGARLAASAYDPGVVDRYGLRASEFRLPKSEAGRRAWAVQTSVDGFTLLALATADGAPSALWGVAALETLRQVWVQNFLVEHGPEGPRVGWRANDQAPPSGRSIGSPYDTQARHVTKARRCGAATRRT